MYVINIIYESWIQWIWDTVKLITKSSRLHCRGSLLQPLWPASAIYSGGHTIGGDDSVKADTNSASLGDARCRFRVRFGRVTRDPETNSKSTWKWMVGILVSFWDGIFSGAMLVSGGVLLNLLLMIFVSTFQLKGESSPPAATPSSQSRRCIL